MSKYDPLTIFLKSRGGNEVRMTFSEIERVIGHKLPAKSKTIRAWWSNNPGNNVLTKAWLAAGYKSAQVDIAGERLSFVLERPAGFSEMTQPELKHQETSGEPSPNDKKPSRHPAWGGLKGMITLLPDVDLTAPAYEDWKKLYGEDK